MPLMALAPLAEVTGVRLISLQKGFGEEQISLLSPSMRAETLGADFDGGPDAFVDTAAAMASLDLVVACDNFGRPSRGSAGRAGLGRAEGRRGMALADGNANSPWYPRMRLFRQSRRGAWRDVFGPWRSKSPRSPRAAPRRR